MKILLTTSRKTSQRVRQFIKEFSYLFPKSFIQRSNRGKLSLAELFDQSLTRYDRILVVTNWHGNPDKIIGYTKKDDEFIWFFEFKIKNVKLSYELQTSKLDSPDKTLISFENVDPDLQNVLSNFFLPFIETGKIVDKTGVRDVYLSHKEKGFELYAMDEEYMHLPPEIAITEIIITDPEVIRE